MFNHFYIEKTLYDNLEEEVLNLDVELFDKAFSFNFNEFLVDDNINVIKSISDFISYSENLLNKEELIEYNKGFKHLKNLLTLYNSLKIKKIKEGNKFNRKINKKVRKTKYKI